jgi:peptide/nickel transport system permease protein
VVGFVLRRLALAALTVLVTSFVVYSSLYLAPGDAITSLTRGRPASPELIASLREQYRLDDPFLVRYLSWLGDALRGDFGQSVAFRQDVGGLITARLGTTLWLATMASILIIGVGLAVGLVSALRPGATDSAFMLGATVLAATPTFVVGLVLIWVFSVSWGWLPSFGSGQGEGVAGRLRHLTLPSIALAVGTIAYVARIVRTSLRAELDGEHTMTATSRGLSRRDVLRRHVFRNAAGPIITVSGLVVAGLIGGTAIVEKLFALNGIGSLLIDSVDANDFPVVQAIALIAVVVFIIVNTTVDVVAGLLDPRIGVRGEQQ